MPGVVSRNRAVYRFRGPFFVPFLGKQKRKLQNRSKNKTVIFILIPATRQQAYPAREGRIYFKKV